MVEFFKRLVQEAIKHSRGSKYDSVTRQPFLFNDDLHVQWNVCNISETMSAMTQTMTSYNSHSLDDVLMVVIRSVEKWEEIKDKTAAKYFRSHIF